MIPDWFWKAVETPSEEHKVEVDECDVEFAALEPRPGLLGAAKARRFKPHRADFANQQRSQPRFVIENAHAHR